MKVLLQQCAAYTIWANQKIFDCIANLTDDQINREITSSFCSIHKTVLHMWDAESAWYQRLKLAEKMQMPSADFNGTFLEMVTQLNQQSAIWKDWVDNATEVQLQHVFAYQNSKKEQFKQPVYEMLLHLFNHNTYHRGQLVTMLRQLGVDKIPPTDFSVFCRKK
ncbi:MAG TPA: DinB family protein [Ferruginibacter sp.]|nr:DinB family protein [Ferruginibacter sp.]